MITPLTGFFFFFFFYQRSLLYQRYISRFHLLPFYVADENESFFLNIYLFIFISWIIATAVLKYKYPNFLILMPSHAQSLYDMRI